MSKLKIGYFGDGPWSHLALEKIVGDPHIEICFIVARYQKPDQELKRRALALGVPFLTHENINSPEFRAKIGESRADLFVSMSFDQIVRADILKMAPKGFINCHAGALPFYRGRNVLNWAIINGESKIGVTVHHIDLSIDTGDIIQQDWIPVEASDDYASILDKAYIQCAASLHTAIHAIRINRVKLTPQAKIHPVGLYCGRRVPGDELLDWNWPSERIHNFVRGITLPGPGARTLCEDKMIAILKTQLIPEAPAYVGTPGEVVGRHEDGSVVIKTGDSTLRVSMIDDVTPSDALAGNIRAPKFKMGRRLGVNLLSLHTKLAMQNLRTTLPGGT